MQQTIASYSTPSKASPTPGTSQKPTTPSGEGGKGPSAVFISMALDMSWRLAIVVLVPIIGGFKLDEALKLTPLLTITGFLLAMIGMGLVCWQTLQAANQESGVSTPKEKKH